MVEGSQIVFNTGYSMVRPEIEKKIFFQSLSQNVRICVPLVNTYVRICVPSIMSGFVFMMSGFVSPQCPKMSPWPTTWSYRR